MVVLLINRAIWATETVDMIFSDGHPKVQIPVIKTEGTIFLSLVTLAEACDASLSWNPILQKMIVKIGRSQMNVIPFNATVVIDEVSYHLPLKPTIKDGTFYVPAEAFCELFDRLVPGDLRWDSSKKVVILKTGAINILNLTVEEKNNGTLVTIRTKRQFKIEERTGKPNWLHIYIQEGKLDPSEIEKVEVKGAVKQVIARQFEKTAQVSLLIDQQVSSYKVYQTDNPRRIIISLRKPITKSSKQINDPQPGKELWTFHTVIIDAGHGGYDPGSVGPTGLTEGEVTFDIAKRLAELLRENLHLRVVLTRKEEGEFVPLLERARIATRNDGKLFISIHTNADPIGNSRGTEVYFLSDAKTEDAKAVARRENSSIKYEKSFASLKLVKNENFYISDILTDMVSDQFLKESQDLAASIQSEISLNLQLKDRGVKQAGFYVMKGTLATMPSVLIEVAFISNRYEEKLLKTRIFRQRMAEAIYKGIKAFKIKYESSLGLNY